MKVRKRTIVPLAGIAAAALLWVIGSTPIARRISASDDGSGGPPNTAVSHKRKSRPVPVSDASQLWKERIYQLDAAGGDPVASSLQRNAILGRWARVAPAEAARWLVSASREPAAADWRPVVDVWAAAEPEACGDWIRTLPRGAAFDSAALAYASAVAQIDPGNAVRWAEAISNNLERSEALAATMSAWSAADPDAAAAHAWSAGHPPHILGLSAAADPAEESPVLLPSLFHPSP